MSRPFTYVEPSVELRAVLNSASEAFFADRFDQKTYERLIRRAEAAGATLSDIRYIERYAIILRLERVASLHTQPANELAHFVRELIGGPLRTRLAALFAAARTGGHAVTPYAHEDVEEYFAECFSAYVYHPSELRERDADGYDLIEAALQKIW